MSLDEKEKIIRKIGGMYLWNPEVYILVRFCLLEDPRITKVFASKVMCEDARDTLNEEMQKLGIQYKYGCITKKIK